MRLTIIPSDKNVGIDSLFFIGLDLTEANIPSNIHALQWHETEGEIEFVDNPDRTKPMNEVIIDLPSWATACVDIWNTEKTRLENIQAEIEAKKLQTIEPTNQ